MSSNRFLFRNRLEEIVGDSVKKLYFQPPENLKLEFPCIVYDMADVKIQKADNLPYTFHKQFTVTVIDKNPDSDIYEHILNGFEYASFDRSFKSDNFNHFVLTIYW